MTSAVLSAREQASESLFSLVHLEEVRHQDVFTLREWYRDYYENRFGKTRGSGFYTPDDWRRIDFAYHRLQPGGDFLDVGIGQGQWLKLIHQSQQFSSITGVDIKWHNKLPKISDDITLKQMSVTGLQFEDNAFDVTTCFEVLEHLPKGAFEQAVSELRRVTKRQLFISVPYWESLPLYRSHHQRFTDERLRTIFPDAKFTVLRPSRRNALPWILIEEEYPQKGLPSRDPSGDSYRSEFYASSQGSSNETPPALPFLKRLYLKVKTRVHRLCALSPRQAEACMETELKKNGVTGLEAWFTEAIDHERVEQEYLYRIMFDLLRKVDSEKAWKYGFEALKQNPDNLKLRFMLMNVYTRGT